MQRAAGWMGWMTCVLGAWLLSGCGAALLKKPVEDQCTRAGLRGCPELTDGVIAFASGEEQRGAKLLAKAAAKNEPAQMEPFILGLEALAAAPGSPEALATVVKLLRGELPLDDQEASGEPGSVGQAVASGSDDGGSPSRAASAKGTNAGVRGAVVDRGPSSVPAPGLPGWPVAGRVGVGDPTTCKQSAADARCYLSRMGPLVVTDVAFGTGCEGATLVAVEPSESGVDQATWAVSRDLSGGQWPVDEWESVVLIVPSGASGTCTVSWAGTGGR